MLQVQSVLPGSIAAEIGITPGFTLEAIDSRALTDFLDWEFLTAADRFVLTGRSANDEPYEFDIERPENVPMGVTLEPPSIRRCANRCDFCFVDGLPEGLRSTLYIRDDDYRLSFRYGNFATLTNLKQKDVDRIIEYRLSPLYVSVHATDTVVRRRLLRNPRAPDVLAQLSFFGGHGIRFHTQIVLQSGLNDGIWLERSLEDLYDLSAAVLTVSVVPVGLTDFSKHHLVDEPKGESCRDALRIVEAYQHRALAERHARWAYGSDDLYLCAGSAFPPASSYDGFEQVENGVGSVRYLQERIREAATELPDLEGTRIAVCTGTAMGGLMPFVLEPLEAATQATYPLVVLENQLFGPSAGSAGLLPGRAFAHALAGGLEADLALVPAEAVNDEGLFLDDLSFDTLKRDAPMDVRLSYTFVDALRAGVSP